MSSILLAKRIVRAVTLRAGPSVFPRAFSSLNVNIFQHSGKLHKLPQCSHIAFRSLHSVSTIRRDISTHGSDHGTKHAPTDDGNTYVGEQVDGQRHGQGILTFQNGQVLQGEFKNGRFFNGTCTLLVTDDVSASSSNNNASSESDKPVDETGYDDIPAAQTVSKSHLNAALASPVGRVYDGTFENGNLHGYGSVTYADGRVLSGEFKNGHLFSGVGVKNIGDGRIYEGQFRFGKINGPGKITHSDGSILEGEFKNGDIWLGTGVKRLSNGTTLTGSWRKGKLNGQGRIQLACGGVWIGEFLHGREHNGYGKIEFKDGRIYEGTLVEGKMHGDGKLIHQGAVQEGEFKYNFFRMGSQRPVDKTDFYRSHLPPPVSKSIDRKGITYEGEKVDGVRHGVGIITYKNGRTWEGTFNQGVMYSGEGYVELEDGRTYEGDWLEGFMHGSGKLFLNDKLCWEGEFMLGQKLPNGPSGADEADRSQQRAKKFKSGVFKKKRVWRDNKYAL